MRMTMGRRAYPSDLTDEQWELLAPLIPEPSLDGRLPELSRREIVNGILYVLRSGCPWRLLPHDLPAWGTVYWYFRTLARRRRLGSRASNAALRGSHQARPKC